MRWPSVLALVLTGFGRPSWGQLVNLGNNTVQPIWGLAAYLHGAESTICNGTFADANATGIFATNPDVPQGPQAGQPENTSGQTADFGMAVTITNAGGANASDKNSSALSVWANTNGANYNDNFALGYDVCGLAGFNLNYNTQLRGQDDDSTCSSALNQPCISAIETYLQQWAGWLTTPNGASPSNLTNTTLPSVCTELSSQLASNFPDECSEFFGQKAALGWPLTTSGAYQTVLSDCYLNSTWQNVISFFDNNSISVYDTWYQSVVPVILVWMPIAIAGADMQGGVGFTTIPQSVAKIACLHANNVTEGSLEPPAAPTPTPIADDTTSNSTSSSNNTTTTSSPAANTNSNTNKGLSGGAIAGIVIGVIAGLGLLAGVLFWLWRKKRTTAPTTTDSQFPEDRKGMAEVHGDNGQRSELPNTQRNELAGSHYNSTAEMGASKYGYPANKPSELEGDRGIIGELE